MFLSTNILSIVYTFSWEYISISSHIMVCPFIWYYKRSLILCSCLLIVSLLYILFPENISLFPLISWFVLYLILQAFTNLCSCLLIVSPLYILFPENISLFPLMSWFVLYLILQAFTNPVFLSTNSLSIVYTFSWEYISISSHIVVCPLFNITSIH